MRTALGALATAGLLVMGTGCAPQATNQMDANSGLGSVLLERESGPVSVRVELWRDVQPGADEGPLTATIILTAEGEGSLEHLSVDEVVLAQGSRSWTGRPGEERALGPTSLSYTLRGGPPWPADALVDVTVLVATEAETVAVPIAGVRVRVAR